MDIKIIYNKKIDDLILKNVNSNDSDKITDWWMHKEEPIFLIENDDLRLKLIREEVFNIVAKKSFDWGKVNGN